MRRVGALFTTLNLCSKMCAPSAESSTCACTDERKMLHKNGIASRSEGKSDALDASSGSVSLSFCLRKTGLLRDDSYFDVNEQILFPYRDDFRQIEIKTTQSVTQLFLGKMV